MLGLENNSASYLFIKASDAQERWRQLRSMLPGEKEVFKYVQYQQRDQFPNDVLDSSASTKQLL